MGTSLCKSANAEPQKDPEDRSLDEVDIEQTKVAIYDEAFDGAAGPLNSLVTVNNDLCSSVENVKILAACFLGAVDVRVTGGYKVTLQKQAVELMKEPLEELYMTNPALKRACEATNSAADSVTSAASLPGVTITAHKGDRLGVKVSGAEADDIKTAKAAVTNYNVALYALKKLAIKTSTAESMNLSAAVKETLANFKKADKDMKPECKVDDAKLQTAMTGGDVEAASVVTLDLHLTEALPDHLRTAYEALLGEDGLMAAISEAIDEISGFQDTCTEAQAAVEALPKDPEGIASAAQSSGLGPMQLMKAAKLIGINSKALTVGPDILKQATATLTWTIGELKLGVEMSKNIAAAKVAESGQAVST